MPRQPKSNPPKEGQWPPGCGCGKVQIGNKRLTFSRSVQEPETGVPPKRQIAFSPPEPVVRDERATAGELLHLNTSIGFRRRQAPPLRHR